MYWNHRVMLRKERDEDVLYIVEVYYDTDSGGIIGWTEREEIWGENLEELRNSLNWMLECLDKPVLNEAELLAQAKELAAAGEDVHEIGLVARAPGFDGDDFRELTMEELNQWESEGGSL